MTPDKLIDSLRELNRIAWHGCSDVACVMNPGLNGQHTNGGCNCRFTIQRTLRYLQTEIEMDILTKERK